jgi:hypothetical protein
VLTEPCHIGRPVDRTMQALAPNGDKLKGFRSFENSQHLAGTS